MKADVTIVVMAQEDKQVRLAVAANPGVIYVETNLLLRRIIWGKNLLLAGILLKKAERAVNMQPFFKRQFHNLAFEQEVFLLELLSRGIDVDIVEPKLGVMRARFKGHEELLFERDSSIMPYSVSVIAGDKVIAKQLMTNKGIKVPVGANFDNLDFEPIKKAFTNIGKPVVLKPSFGSFGWQVYPNLKKIEDVSWAVKQVRSECGNDIKTLIEEHFDGREYRVLLTKKGNYVAAMRDPAHVFGDGESTVSELVEKENKFRTSEIFNTLNVFKIDGETERVLSVKNMTMTSVPESKEKVYLRYNSNTMSGGTFEDCTDRVHSSVIKNCERVFDAFPGLPYAGIDYMTNDISEEQRDYRIIEVNTNPSVFSHAYPSHGKSQNAAKLIVDMIYPETSLI